MTRELNLRRALVCAIPALVIFWGLLCGWLAVTP